MGRKNEGKGKKIIDRVGPIYHREILEPETGPMGSHRARAVGHCRQSGGKTRVLAPPD